MAPERLAEQAAVLEQYPDCAFVAVQTRFHGPAWEPLHLNAGRGPALASGWILPDEPHGTLLGEVPHHGAVMLRRSAYERVGGEALRRFGNPGCRTYLARAIRERPSTLRAWVRLAQAVRLSRPSLSTRVT